ncbi:MAG: polyphosphate kinase 1 [Candidatus Hydrogenedentes bacterium]|nr:polyphosphate kinase 1 [Candidatus Hydrogenedentota bacterium]
MKNIHQIREISTISFNERVLQEAEDPRNPLMERLRFLGIFSSNMDELFKVRVASIHRRIELGKKGLHEVLEALAQKAIELDERFRVAYAGITAALAEEDIHIPTEHEIRDGDPEIARWIREFFRKELLPSIVPIICHKRLPFPELMDSVLYLGVAMRGENKRYGLLEIPPETPRFVELPNHDIMYIDDVIRFSLDDIFYIFEYERIDAYAFKISRDAELDMDNDFTEGYVRKMEKVLRQRRGGRPTRMVYDAEMPPGLLKILKKELHIREDDTMIPGGRYHNMRDLMKFPSRRKDLEFPRFDNVPHPVLDRVSQPMLETIKRGDLMITYPYQSFDHLIRLLREAAIDPKVETIKMTLYRAARPSQVVNALYNAARNGKRIVVSIELQARFDEENNIFIANKLTEVGATVVYGVPPMKVHAKLLLIQRRNQNFAGFSTGNFNESTGRLYVDSLLLTTDARLIKDTELVFEYLEKSAKMRVLATPQFEHLLVSPFNSHGVFLALIAREQAKGDAGYIFIKVNHLTDPSIIKALRDAADAGVKMDLIVRTTYAMRPHPNIRAISILDRYLEHQRVYIFGNGDDRAVYMSSADLMERNLDWRVESAFPVYDKTLQRQVAAMMALQVADTAKARVLDQTQSNHYVGGDTGGKQSQIETRRFLQDLYEASSGTTEPEYGGYEVF